MGDIAITVDEQIKKLESRGLVINNDEERRKAKEYLLDIGYYRLGFYWYYFQDKESHDFYNKIKLNDIVKLYYFDFDVKMLLLRYIYRIEVYFRTQLVYYASNHYNDNNTWYVDPKLMNETVLENFDGIYDKLLQNCKTLIKHHDKHECDYAPAWKVFEFLTFGQVFKLYTGLKNNELKKKICGIYGFRDVGLLINYFVSIINIRNICAHNGVLFDYDQPIGIRRIPNHKYRNQTRNNTNLNASIRLLLYILSKTSKNRAIELEDQIKSIFTKSSENELVKTIILDKIKLDL